MLSRSSLSHPTSISRAICLYILARIEESADDYRKLSTNAPNHPYAKDLEAKSALFDEAAAKFSITA
jgi:coatomer protein complex subunit epsilon